VLKWVLLILSVAVAIVPAIFVAVRVSPTFPKVTIGEGITTCAFFTLALGLIFIIRGLEKRYAHKLPWATTALIWSWALYLIIRALGKIIAQSEQISLALAVGISVSFVLSLGSELCKTIEHNTEEEYKRFVSEK
jgi:uncharacterized membrane protein YagU involved in acid resistance